MSARELVMLRRLKRQEEREVRDGVAVSLEDFEAPRRRGHASY